MIWPYNGLFGLYDFENGKRWRHMNFYFQLILKSPKNYENLGFWTSGLCLAFKIFFGLFFNFPDLQMSWIFQIIQIWIILKQFCHQIIFAEKFTNRISVGGGTGEGYQGEVKGAKGARGAREARTSPSPLTHTHIFWPSTIPVLLVEK